MDPGNLDPRRLNHACVEGWCPDPCLVQGLTVRWEQCLRFSLDWQQLNCTPWASLHSSRCPQLSSEGPRSEHFLPSPPPCLCPSSQLHSCLLWGLCCAAHSCSMLGYAGLSCLHPLSSFYSSSTQPLLRTLDIGNVIFRYFYFLNHALLCNINLKRTESTFLKDSNLPHELFCLFAPLMSCLHFVFCGKSNLCRSYSEAVTACCMVSCLS